MYKQFGNTVEKERRLIRIQKKLLDKFHAEFFHGKSEVKRRIGIPRRMWEKKNSMV
jgi:hypothetical protein